MWFKKNKKPDARPEQPDDNAFKVKGVLEISSITAVLATYDYLFTMQDYIANVLAQKIERPSEKKWEEIWEDINSCCDECGFDFYAAYPQEEKDFIAGAAAALEWVLGYGTLLDID